jgi:hypothetical protein
LRSMESGVYRVRFEPTRNGEAVADPVQVKWVEGGSAKVTVPGLQSGLYQLDRLDAKDQKAGPDAWILVSGPADFDKNRAAYQQAVDATQSWPDNVDARAPRAFLRGVLDGLSRQTQNLR